MVGSGYENLPLGDVHLLLVGDVYLLLVGDVHLLLVGDVYLLLVGDVCGFKVLAPPEKLSEEANIGGGGNQISQCDTNVIEQSYYWKLITKDLQSRG